MKISNKQHEILKQMCTVEEDYLLAFSEKDIRTFRALEKKGFVNIIVDNYYEHNIMRRCYSAYWNQSMPMALEKIRNEYKVFVRLEE